MRIDIITLFPEMFKGPFDESILRRAQEKSLIDIILGGTISLFQNLKQAHLREEIFTQLTLRLTAEKLHQLLDLEE